MLVPETRTRMFVCLYVCVSERESGTIVHVCNCYSCSVRGENVTNLLIVTEAMVQQETCCIFIVAAH